MARSQLWSLETGDAGIISSGRWWRTRTLIWTVLLFTGAFGLFYASVFSAQWLHLSGAMGYCPALLIPALSFVLYSRAVHMGERRIASEIALTRSTVSDLAIGAAIGFSFLVGMILLLWALGLYHVERSHLSNWFDSFVFDSYISGMLEELAFRAILLRLGVRLFGPMPGLILSSILFGVAHITHGSWLGVVGIIVNAGLTIGLLYMATGRLWMSVGMHIAWDFTEESFLGVNTHHGFLLSTPVAERSALLSGGNFGPDASLLTMILGLMLALGIRYANSCGAFRELRSRPEEPSTSHGVLG